MAQGGMGIVFSAFDTQLKRKVAIKSVRGEHLEDVTYRKRLLREAKSLCSLRHPNIVRVYDLHDSPELTYLVLEFVEGISLGELRRTAMLQPIEAVQIMVKLADALDTIHKAEIMHRDIKPDNILITSEGKPTFIDFGLTLRDEKVEETRLTRSDCVVGTVGYIAPELLFGEEHTVKCDVYQLGAVFYELVTNEHMIDSQQFNELLRGKPIDIPRPSMISKADKELDDIILSAVQFDADQRLASAKDLLDGCNKWLKKHDKEEFRTLDTLVTQSMTVVTPIEPLKEDKKGKLSWLAICLLSLVLLANYLSQDTKTAALEKVGADWVSFTLSKEGSYRIVTAEERKLAHKGNAVAGPEVKIGPLQTETDYLMFFGDNDEHTLAFRTQKLVTISKPRVYAIADAFFLSIDTNLQYGSLKIVAGTNKKVAQLLPGKKRIIVKNLSLGPKGVVPWRLLYGDKEITKGQTYATNDFRPDGKLASKDPNFTACWSEDKLYLCDRYWQLSETTTGIPTAKTRNELLAVVRQWKPKNQKTLRRFRWCMPIEEQLLFCAGLSPDSSKMHTQLLDIKMGTFKSSRIRFKNTVCLVDRPVVNGGKLLFHGTAASIPSWFLFSAKIGTLLSTSRGPKTKSSKLQSPSSPISMDFGRNRAFRKGYGFLTPPVLFANRFFSLYGESEGKKNNWVKAQLLSVAIEKGDKLTPPRQHGTFETWVGSHSFGKTRGGEVLTIAGREAIYGIGLSAGTCLKMVDKGSVDGYFASPACEMNGKYYSLLANQTRSGVGQLDQVMKYHNFHLLSWQEGEEPTVNKRAIFRTSSSSYQVPSVRYFVTWKDRYIVGATHLNIFAIDLLQGKSGSVHYAGEVIEEVSLNDDGTIFVILRGVRLSVLPVELVVESNSQKL